MQINWRKYRIKGTNTRVKYYNPNRYYIPSNIKIIHCDKIGNGDNYPYQLSDWEIINRYHNPFIKCNKCNGFSKYITIKRIVKEKIINPYFNNYNHYNGTDVVEAIKRQNSVKHYEMMQKTNKTCCKITTNINRNQPKYKNCSKPSLDTTKNLTKNIRLNNNNLTNYEIINNLKSENKYKHQKYVDEWYMMDRGICLPQEVDVCKCNKDLMPPKEPIPPQRKCKQTQTQTQTQTQKTYTPTNSSLLDDIQEAAINSVTDRRLRGVSDESYKGNSWSIYRNGLWFHISEWNMINITNFNQIFDNTFYSSTTSEIRTQIKNFNQDISSWDVSKATSMWGMFFQATNFNHNIGGWDVSKVTDMNYMFAEATNFNQDIRNWNISSISKKSINFANNSNLLQDYLPRFILYEKNKWDYGDVDLALYDNYNIANGTGIGYRLFSHISNWNMSQVTNMSQLFVNKRTFNYNISGWDVGKVTNMNQMFSGANQFNQDISGWNVSQVTDMNLMFNQAKNFNQDIGGWDISSVGGNFNRFADNSNLLRDYLPRFILSEINKFEYDDINQALNDNYNIANGTGMGYRLFSHISNWNVSQVTDMNQLFLNRTTFNYNISGWDVSKVTDMNQMFSGVSDFNQDISGWNVSQVTDINEMFKGATSFNQNLLIWVTNKVINHDNFAVSSGFEYFNQYWPAFGTLNVSDGNLLFTYINDMDTDSGRYERHLINDWNVSGVKNMDQIFFDKGDFNHNIGGWNVSQVTTMFYLFSNATHFNQDISGWNVSKVKNMTGMFKGATNFNQDIGEWDVSQVTDMEQMFIDATNFNQDISSWNVSKVFNMEEMFFQATNFNQNIGSWKVNEVGNMNGMFYHATNFNHNIGGWNVSKVIDMGTMFAEATNFNQDISGWNVSEVSNMSYMFYNAKNFNQDISGWNVSEVKYMSYMFYNAKNFNYNIGEWDVSKVVDMGEMFSSATKFNQDISGWNVDKVINHVNFAQNSGFGNYNQYWPDFQTFETINISDRTELIYFINNIDHDGQFGGYLINDWNVTQVKDMNNLIVLAGRTEFNYNIGGWDVSQVTDMEQMFLHANNFNQNISSWDVGKVGNMSFMFGFANDFNQNISGWDVSQVTVMNEMFFGATNFNQNISGWDVSQVTNYAGFADNSGFADYNQYWPDSFRENPQPVEKPNQIL